MWSCDFAQRSADISSEAKRIAKNPNVDTSFLPDRDREELERLHREDLRKEWLANQEQMKLEIIEITYSYWDGSGHRKSVEVRGAPMSDRASGSRREPLVKCKKGDDIAAFLSKCRSQFPELRGTSVDNLMYIKV